MSVYKIHGTEDLGDDDRDQEIYSIEKSKVKGTGQDAIDFIIKHFESGKYGKFTVNEIQDGKTTIWKKKHSKQEKKSKLKSFKDFFKKNKK